MVGVKVSHSAADSIVSLKHHSRMPPLLKMEKKSNMTAPVSSKVCKQLFDKYKLCTKDDLY